MKILTRLGDGIDLLFDVAGAIIEFFLQLFVIVGVFGGIAFGLLILGHVLGAW